MRSGLKEAGVQTCETTYRMLERWRQENHSKYMRLEDALHTPVGYKFKPTDLAIEFHSPGRTRVEKRLKAAGQGPAKMERDYGAEAFDNLKFKRGSVICHYKGSLQNIPVLSLSRNTG